MNQINDALDTLAAAFTGEYSPERDILDPQGHEGTCSDIIHPERLDRDRLDYSVASLKLVDAYLTHLHRRYPEWPGAEWTRTVLRTGAYVGEVIRRNAPRAYDWVEFAEYVEAHPRSVRVLGEDAELAVCALLATADGRVTLPLNRVLAFLGNGAEASVQRYAETECHED
ncbi:hypothetical protein E0L36_10600 [Streptomyces sp. AJS327]|uniref:hypothetical protein n=1 Tax=Streptomyces sp. AJS327 TaxID=2545265 RepID=UPI0015E0522E|nr:hypothetical protein [Streptomyces sp. AJS327]MBA0051322.1 hypothetical protein [Streptomyces sp. AJS327]